MSSTQGVVDCVTGQGFGQPEPPLPPPLPALVQLVFHPWMVTKMLPVPEVPEACTRINGVSTVIVPTFEYSASPAAAVPKLVEVCSVLPVNAPKVPGVSAPVADWNATV